MNESTEVKQSPPDIIHVGRPDWMCYQRFFEVVGGVEGYFRLRDHEPRLLKQVMESFGITLSPEPQEQ